MKRSTVGDVKVAKFENSASDIVTNLPIAVIRHQAKYT